MSKLDEEASYTSEEEEVQDLKKNDYYLDETMILKEPQNTVGTKGKREDSETSITEKTSIRDTTSNSFRFPTSREFARTGGTTNSSNVAVGTEIMDHTSLERQLRDLIERVNLLEEKNAKQDYDPDTKYPQDCYSLIALNGPRRNGLWVSNQRFMFFLFGMTVFLFQTGLLTLSIWSAMDRINGTVGESDNPDEGFWSTFIQPNTNTMVKMTQVLSLLVFVVFPESSLQDVATAIHMFSWSSTDTGHQLWSLRLSCSLKLFQGILAIIAMWLLVMTSDRVVDIILNFTAINFISNIDDLAFELAGSGVFGPAVKEEVSNISEHAKLPACVHRERKDVWYWRVMATTFLFLFGFMIFVFVNQDSSEKWVTKFLRVEFKDQDFKQYSGCYDLNVAAGKESKRYSYSSRDPESNISIGYCRRNRQWIFFDVENDTSMTACDARIDGLDVVHSSKTDSFDISSSFEETWVSSSGAPLQLFFFDSDLPEEELYCDFSLGDGVCNEEFNTPGYSFDEGDCCAATCALSNCGRENQIPAFNGQFHPRLSFLNCKDPDMVPLRISINGIKSSRHEDFFSKPWHLLGQNRASFKGSINDGKTMEDIIQQKWKCPNFKACNLEDWRAETPKKPYFNLECDGLPVFTIDIEEAIVNKSVTVMVTDGANCTLEVQNSTKLINRAPVNADPIWIVDYTIFHGDAGTVEDSVEVLKHQSSDNEIVSFERIPDCYFRRLHSFTNIKHMYPGAGPTNEAVEWLLEDDARHSDCEEQLFIERYKLAKVMLDLNLTEYISEMFHCLWKGLSCNNLFAAEIDLSFTDAFGTIPSEVGLLTSLTRINLCKITLKSDTNDFFLCDVSYIFFSVSRV